MEDLGVELLANDGYKKVFERLDKGFQFDPLTELHGDFERFFIFPESPSWTDLTGLHSGIYPC